MFLCWSTVLYRFFHNYSTIIIYTYWLQENQTFGCYTCISTYFYAPLRRRGGICILFCLCRYVGWSVGQMVSVDYLVNHLSQSCHISHVDWSWLVHDPNWFGVTRSKVIGGICVVWHFLFILISYFMLIDQGY